MKLLSSAIVSSLFFWSGCAATVDQDAKSGKDAKSGGAKEIKLEGGKGRARDIVTYPGGDRVDWKTFELPEDSQHLVKITVAFRGARNGLDLAFDVYDQYFHRVGRARPSRRPPRRKSVKLRGATGKYYLQIYAPRRGDAAEYIVTVKTKPQQGGGSADAGELIAMLPDPPTLPAVPEPDPVAGGNNPDGTGPNGTGPNGTGPNGTNPNCTGPDCTGAGGNDVPKGPIRAKIVRFKAASGGAIIRINRGTDAGVQPGWSGKVLSSSGRPLNGGGFQIINANKKESVGRVKLSIDQVKRNTNVELSP